MLAPHDRDQLGAEKLHVVSHVCGVRLFGVARLSCVAQRAKQAGFFKSHVLKFVQKYRKETPIS